MAVDRKYGLVNVERGDIGDDEPVVVFRAQDVLLTQVLAHYMMLCLQAGSPARHITGIAASIYHVAQWQSDNRTQLPRSGRG